MSRYITNKVNKTPNNKVNMGAAAYYIQISDRYGFKFYTSQRMAKHTFMLQHFCHKIGCAPAVSKFIETTVKLPNWDKSHKVWGYIVVNIGKLAAELQGDEYEAGYKKLNVMREKMAKAGFSCGDMHAFNIGLSKSGKAQAIDFSHMSLRRNGVNYAGHESSMAQEFTMEEVLEVQNKKKRTKKNVSVAIDYNEVYASIPCGC